MRICIVNEFFHPDNTGGTGTVLSDLVRSLRGTQHDIQIDVITSKNLYRQKNVTLPAYENWNGVQIHRLATPRPNDLPTLLRLTSNALFCAGALVRFLRLGRYDAILVGTAPPMVALSANILNCLRGTPFIYIVYDLEPDRSVTMKVMSHHNPAIRIFRWNQKRWLHSAAKVVVLGRCMRDYLSKTYDLPEQKVEVISIGSDPGEIVPGPKETKFRAEHGLQGFILLYSGNFGRYHNFDTLLDAAKELCTKRPEISFVLVGGGAQKEHIAHRIADEKIANVHLYDFVSKDAYNDLLASADVSFVTLEPGMEGLCVPSKFYSILASGRPVIAAVSPKSEVALVIDEAQCGTHVDQSIVAELVNALTFFADNPAEAERMGRNAREVLEAKYSTHHIAGQYYRLLQEATHTASGHRQLGSTQSSDLPRMPKAEAPSD